MSRPDEWIDQLCRENIRQFLIDHVNEDSHSLSLRFREIDGIPFPVIASQLRARQKAKEKLPLWFASECIVYPPLANLEQSSSELTAKYKAEIFSGNVLVDLTGGTGVDTFFLSPGFDKVIYVEEQPFLCRLAEHNFNCLKKNIEVICVRSEDFLKTLNRDPAEVSLYIDPSRRDDKAKKVFLLSDCSPDMVDLLPTITSSSRKCLVKLSPMLDVKQTMLDLAPYVSAIHIVAVDNEVKELLILIAGSEEHSSEKPLIHAINVSAKKEQQVFRFTEDEERSAQCQFGSHGKFLYEPNAAIMKGGAFTLVADRYDLLKAAPNTHLYFSDTLVPEFPGRIFAVDELTGYNPKIIKKAYSGSKANVSVRNFPEDVRKIRKRTGLKDGGNLYLFFFTGDDGSLLLAKCRKFSKPTPS